MVGFNGKELLWIISGAPWTWAYIRDDGSAAHDVHRSFRSHSWRSHGLLTHLLMAAGFVIGIPVVLGMIAVLTALHGRRVWEQVRKGRLRLAKEQLALWLTQGVLPVSYFIFELYRDDARAEALNYLYRHETKKGLYPIFRERFSSQETTAALRDKAQFARRCEEHGVAAVPALFVVVDGSITRFDGGGPGLPRCDLFLKPLSGAGGRGAVVWTYLGNQTYQNAEKGWVSEAQLIAHLQEQSQSDDFVGRLYVSNHPELAEVSSGALCSVRVVSCLDEQGNPEITHAVLRMAQTPGIVVDNFHAGGIAAPVDLETGIIGMATDLGLNRHTRWWGNHPTTSAPIVGRRVPMWDRVADLARRAHAAFPDQIVVGWDVAVLESGPSMIEGNKGPDLDIIQRTASAPIGNSRLGVLLAHHLHRALGEEPLLQRTVSGDVDLLDRHVSANRT